MVIGDPYHSENQNASSLQRKGLYTPSPADRFLSFAFDFVVLSPLSGFAAVFFFRDFKSILLHSDSLVEILASFVPWAFVYFSVYFLLQTLSLIFLQGTPGQIVFSMKVKALDGRPLTFLQAWLRAMGPWISLALLGIPFLELFSHYKRKTFYDRLTDTEVLSFKKVALRSPQELEVRFMRQWTSTFFILIYVTGFFSISGLQKKSGREPNPLKAELKNCQASQAFEESQDASALDRLISLYLIDEKYDVCLKKKMEQSEIFSKEAELSYFASYLLTEDENLKESYTKQLCGKSESKSEFCQVLKNQKVSFNSKSSLSARIYWLKKNKNSSSEKFLVMDQLVKEPILFKHFVKEYVQAYLQLQKGRAPASVQLENAEERFLERMGSEE